MPYIGSLWQTLAIPWFSLQVAYIGTDIFQMLVALIFFPRVANELAWKRLFAGNVTYDSKQNAF